MHFLGLAGMPRRIPDYPDCFWFWNKISTFGHCCTTTSLLIFSISLIFFEPRGFKTVWQTRWKKVLDDK
jgi:cytochrome c oxidase subunit 1